MKQASLLLTVAALLFIVGCTSMIANLAGVTPVPNYFPVHESPRIGDFAVYRSLDGSQLMRMEITAVTDGGVRIRVRWPQATGPAGGFLRGHAYDFDVRRDGRVVAATLLDLATGNGRTVMPAGPGDVGYIEKPVLRPLEGQDELPLGGERHPISGVLYYEATMDGVAGPARMTSTNFMSDAVPFALVRQVNVHETEVTAVEVAQFINRYAGTGNLASTLLDWLLEKAKHQRAENGMVLVDYGFR